MKFTNVSRRLLPEIWIAQQSRQQQSPVTTEQFKHEYRIASTEEALDRLHNLERDRRVRRVVEDGQVVGWRARL